MANWKMKSWVAGLFAAGLSAAGTGCVTEYGRPKPSIWTSIDNKDAEPPTVKLKHPGRMHLIAGQVAERRQLHADARKHYQEALKADPKEVQAMLGLARLDQYAGRIADARNGFDRARKLAPNDHRVLDSVGMFYASQGQWRESIALLRRAVDAKPDDKDHRFDLGVVLAKSGNYAAALPQFVAAVGEARAHYHLGYLLYEQGRRADAAREFQIALSLQPDLEAPKVMLTRLGYGPSPAQSAGASPPPQNRPSFAPTSVQSVGHVARPRDLGSQSAWNGGSSDQQRFYGGSQQPSDGPTIIPGPARQHGHPSQVQQPAARRSAYPPQYQDGRQFTDESRVVVPPPYRGNVY